MRCLDSQCEPSRSLSEYLAKLQATAASGKTVVHFAEQFPGQHRQDWRCEELPWYDGRGNLCFALSLIHISEPTRH
eukprot:11968936-Karenia_brevis.AAC.1